MRWLRCSFQDLMNLPETHYDVAIEEMTREAERIKAASSRRR